MATLTPPRVGVLPHGHSRWVIPGVQVIPGVRNLFREDRFRTPAVLSSEPATIGKKPLGARNVHLYCSLGQHRDWINCIRTRKRLVADVQVAAGGAPGVAFTPEGRYLTAGLGNGTIALLRVPTLPAK
jgi:hypothetical protein